MEYIQFKLQKIETLTRVAILFSQKAVFALLLLVVVASATQQRKQRQARQEQELPDNSFQTAFFPREDYGTMLLGAAYWRTMTGQMVEMLREVSVNFFPALNSAAYRALPHTLNMFNNSANMIVELDLMSSPPLQN